MRIILKQRFPLGRFHASPWRAFTFDDPYGEWPPSPWRLLRAVLARSFQISREMYIDEHKYISDERVREQLVYAFCSSEVSWQLPASSWRGPGIQQYHPSEFKKIPEAKNKPGEKTYKTTKIKDNFWLMPEKVDPLYWFLDPADNTVWDNDLLSHLDECLARMTYFGRAESITRIERMKSDSATFSANCVLRSSRTATAVPVLCPRIDVTFTHVACSTNEKVVVNSTVPPGAVWKYAERPAVVQIRRPQKTAIEPPPVPIMQFAIGGRVFPPLKSWIRLTEKFRGTTLRCLAQRLTEGKTKKFQELPDEIRAEYQLLTGKDKKGKRLTGHQHAALFLIPDQRDRPSRLIYYRDIPFTSVEQAAMLVAAEGPLSWNFGNDKWSLRLVPLLDGTPLPQSKNIFGESALWESLIPYVPPLHVFRPNGKPKPGAGIDSQIRSHLVKLNLPDALIEILPQHQNDVLWMKVHRPRPFSGGRTNDDKRGYRIRITFREPIKGPLYLGHSSHFGIGLFSPR
jgi:CRISPR-associated protein Csb2